MDSHDCLKRHGERKYWSIPSLFGKTNRWESKIEQEDNEKIQRATAEACDEGISTEYN